VIQSNFIGIDLASSPAKFSTCIGLDKQLSLAFFGFLGTDSDIATVVDSQASHLVAIDAPLTLPEGLCCLEESCGCQLKKVDKGRECERELARLGIPSYFTTKRSIIKEMVYRGIKLRKELESRGCKVIEVYPYASKVRLWGKPIPPKTERKGLIFLQDHLASLIPSLASYIADLGTHFNHDLCDAAIAAYTAYLHYWSKTDGVGNPEEGLIYIPKEVRD
jgi:predicted nuclease with RNAse H fold